MKDLLMKLRKERFEISRKIVKLERFRETKEWNELSLNHKELLDIQINAMKTYQEILIARCLDIQQNIIDEEKDELANNDSKHIIEIEII